MPARRSDRNSERAASQIRQEATHAVLGMDAALPSVLRFALQIDL
jgi:hypothetical protein